MGRPKGSKNKKTAFEYCTDVTKIVNLDKKELVPIELSKTALRGLRLLGLTPLSYHQRRRKEKK